MNQQRTAQLIGLLLLAAAGFGLLFQGLFFHFWAQMSLTILGLCLLAFQTNPELLKRALAWRSRDILPDVLIGLVSAVALYLIFWAGNYFSQAWFGFAQPNIAAVYGFKGQTPVWIITLLMGLVIGPGEEIFWRGWLQTRLEKHVGLIGVGLSVAAYTGVHLASLNIMLILAAGVCGAFWCALYYVRRSLWANIISHVLWDLAVFLWFPFQT